MNRFCCFCLAVWMMTAALPSLAQQGPVRIVGLVELSGTGATTGTNFDKPTPDLRKRPAMPSNIAPLWDAIEIAPAGMGSPCE